MKLFFLPVVLVLLTVSVAAQERRAHFASVRIVVQSETSADRLVQRLDSLKSTFIPSRSEVTDYFNRDLEFDVKHRRVLVQLNFYPFNIDILTRNDTILAAVVAAESHKYVHHQVYAEATVQTFLDQRNKLYGSAKSVKQLMDEISLDEEFAFRCGDGGPPTKQGKYIEQLVEEENADTLVEMLKSFNCETQAFGIVGLEMLRRRGYVVTRETQKLINWIKKRNSEVVICVGCLSGLVEKIYTRPTPPEAISAAGALIQY
jgi:hypothetical protein